MAKVFTPEQVRRNQIPRLDDFEQAAHAIMALPEAPELRGTELMIYGSVDERRHDIRSDVDCLVVLPDHLSYAGLARFVKALRGITELTHVPLEPIIVKQSVARSGNHGVESLFLDYLKEVEPDVRFRIGEPAQQLSPATASYEHDYHSFVSAKSEKFTKAMTNPDIDFNAFQRALELPRALDRKWMRLSGTILPMCIETDNPNEPLDFYLVRDAYYYLMAMDAQYNQMLQKLFDSNRNPEDFSEYEAGLAYMYPRIVERAVTLSAGAHTIV